MEGRSTGRVGAWAIPVPILFAVLAFVLAGLIGVLSAPTVHAQGATPGKSSGSLGPTKGGLSVAATSSLWENASINSVDEDCTAGDGVCLYEHAWYGGRWVRFVGTGCYADFTGLGFNDIASSLRFSGSYAGGGYEAVLYEHANYAGAFSAFRGDDPDLTNDAVGNDRASSICVNPVAQPFCPTITDWKGEYWNNRDLSGSPVMCRNDVNVSFNWGSGGPGGGVANDNFSARWTRDLYFNAGRWRFHVASDDGVRLWIDGNLVINQWRDQARTEYTVERDLGAGNHNLRVEYYENAGDANISVWWDQISVGTCPPITDWKGEYWNNRDLSGNPVMCRNDVNVNFNWGSGGPGGGVANDNFSARWTRDLYFNAGRYRFHVASDDGVRLWIDGNLYINQWRDQARTEYTVDLDVGAGNHSLRVEYYEALGDANISVWWDQISAGICPPITSWKGEYWNNRYLSGSPTMCRDDGAVNFSWGTGGPGGGIPNDNFSARWTRDLYFNAGRWRFHLAGDDGVRLWVDGNLIIDQWRDQARTEYTVERDLSAGNHTLKVEYYENLGEASVALWWDQISTTCMNAEYYNNRYLSGSPTFTACENWPIDHNWGSGGPGNGVGNDNFSARWTGRRHFGAGTYNFVARADDGVRVWVSGNLIIDAWRDQAPTEYRRTLTLGEGDYDIRVEYYEAAGGAVIQVWSEQVSSSTGIVVSDKPAFDTCRLPTVAEMQDWWNSSPYYEANMYLGGVNRACNAWNQQNLTSGWVQAVHAQGWNFIPTWVGPQAPCNTSGLAAMSSDANTAFYQGRAEADAAVNAARTAGLTALGSGKTVIYYTIAPYPNNAACRNTVKSFMSGWVGRLHELGMRAGGYGASCASYVSDWVSVANVPDVVWPATANWPSYNSSVTVWNVGSCLPSNYWIHHQRIFQYTPAHNEWWGATSLNIDSNIADGDVAGTHTRLTQAAAQAGQAAVPAQPAGSEILAAKLVTRDEGWVLTGSRLLWSADRGDHFADITPPGAAGLRGAEFVDPQHGWLVFNGSEGVIVARTKDGGRSWQVAPLASAPVDPDAGLSPASISFVDPETGWLSIRLTSGSSFSLAALYATQDGGATWAPLSIPIAGVIDFTSPTTGWVAGGAAGDELYVTRDGGMTWTTQPGLPRTDPGAALFLYGLPSFKNEQEGAIPVTVADQAKPRVEFYRTADGGATWQLVSDAPLSQRPGTAVTTAVVGGDLMFAADPANGALQVAEPGRTSFRTVPGKQLRDAAGVDFATANLGWAVRRYGTCQGNKDGQAADKPFVCEQHADLMRSSDGGTTWEVLRP